MTIPGWYFRDIAKVANARAIAKGEHPLTLYSIDKGANRLYPEGTMLRVESRARYGKEHEHWEIEHVNKELDYIKLVRVETGERVIVTASEIRCRWL